MNLFWLFVMWVFWFGIAMLGFPGASGLYGLIVASIATGVCVGAGYLLR